MCHLTLRFDFNKSFTKVLFSCVKEITKDKKTKVLKSFNLTSNHGKGTTNVFVLYILAVSNFITFLLRVNFSCVKEIVKVKKIIKVLVFQLDIKSRKEDSNVFILKCLAVSYCIFFLLRENVNALMVF